MSRIESTFKKFYDGVENENMSMQKAFEVMRTRPYLITFLKLLHCEEAWNAFKQAQYDAYKNGYNEGLIEGMNAAQSVKAEKAETAKEVVEVMAEPERKAEPTCTATQAAETTCTDYETIREWCNENGVQRYGKGFLLTQADYEKWCDHIGFSDKRLPARSLTRGE